MSGKDAPTVVASATSSAATIGSNADSDVLASYLSLGEPRLVLDLRSDSAFHQAHLVGSYHISPISALKSRYSYLPPRTVPFLVIAESTQHDEVAEAFSSIPSARLVYLAKEDSDPDQPSSSNRIGSIISSLSFLNAARRLGLVRKSRSHRDRVTARPKGNQDGEIQDDVPELLFRPSNAVRRTVASLESAIRQRRALRVLDLGCGAARDLAWILHGSRTRPSSTSWTGVGVDNWKAALTRAQQLMQDLYLDARPQIGDHTSYTDPQCEKLLWSTCSHEGFLQPLVGTGKGKAATRDADNAELWQQYRQLGLWPLLPAPGSSESGEAVETKSPNFDLILCIRFHPRALLPRLSRIVRVGGVILLSHFVTLSYAEHAAAKQAHLGATIDYDSPPDEGRIQPGEIESWIEVWNQSEKSGARWIVESNVLEPIEDGRIIRSAALRKVAVPS